MKNLLIIMTLFMSSFFLFCNKEVKAEEVYIVDYEESVLDYINEDFFKLRNIVIDYAKENSLNYIIRLHNNVYILYFVDISTTNFISTGRTWFENSKISFTYYTVSSSNNFDFGNPSESTITMQSSTNYNVLDSNMDIYYSPYSIQINYMDKSYLVDSTNKMPTLYDIYLDVNNIVPTSHHQEELEKVGSFYNVIIEKLSYLAETIVSNYIYLSIIVIFILIFVFLLIFRRFIC